MRRGGALLLILAACHGPRAASRPADSRPPAATDPASRVAGELDAYLVRAEAAGFSGAVLVAIRGRVVLARGYGWADARGGIRNRADTRFLVASITKTLTAAALARLKAGGKLDWNDSIARHLPGVPEDKRAITIAQLLGHTSGLPDEYRGEAAPDREAAERAILALPLASPPGTAWRYCNDGYALLAAIIERITGERYEDHVRRELLEPAGMTSTGFVWQAAQPPGDLAMGHNGELITDPRSRRRGWGQRGAGGLVTTIEDLHRWVNALADGRIVAPSIQAEMIGAPRPLPNNPGLADGMGWFVVTTARGTRALYHGGNESPAGYTAELRSYVDEGVTTVLACNVMEDDVGLNRMVSPCIEAILFGGRCDWPPPAAARPIEPGLPGVYQLPTGGRFRVGADGWIGADGQDAIDLLRSVDADRRAALARASARVAAGQVPGVSGRVLGTAPVSADLATTTVDRADGRRQRVMWYGDEASSTLAGARWAAPARLVPHPSGGYSAWAPLLAIGVRIWFDAATADHPARLRMSGSAGRATAVSAAPGSRPPARSRPPSRPRPPSRTRPPPRSRTDPGRSAYTGARCEPCSWPSA